MLIGNFLRKAQMLRCRPSKIKQLMRWKDIAKALIS